MTKAEKETNADYACRMEAEAHAEVDSWPEETRISMVAQEGEGWEQPAAASEPVPAETSAPDDGYVSESSIDNPPREEAEPAVNEDGQAELPGVESPKKQAEAAAARRNSREVSFSLQFKADGYVLPVAAGKVPADMVEESLGKGLHSERFKTVLRDVVGDPLNGNLCDQQTATDREKFLQQAVDNFLSGLKSLQYTLPQSPEALTHDHICAKVKEARAKIEQVLQTARTVLGCADGDACCDDGEDF